jgi:glycosyltransferase involved in cell wall biosynthesis
MNIAAVIPVYNEEAQLAATVGTVVQFLGEKWKAGCQVVIAENGSTDRTWEIALELARRHPEVRCCHQGQKGRGRALKAAWSQSDAEILAYMDVDLSTDLSAFLPLIEPLAAGRCDLAIGSRLHPDSVTLRCWKREMISRCYNRLLRLVFGVQFADAQCGFKAITRAAARELLPVVEDTGWFFDTELLVVAEKCGYRIHEQPVRWTEDPDSRVRLASTAWGDLKGIARVYRNLRRGAYPYLSWPESRSRTLPWPGG